MKSALIEPRDEVLRTQRQLLGKLLRTVWNSSTFYRELYSSHGIREHQLADLGVSELPIIDKALLMENFDRAVTDSRLRRSSVERWLDEVRDPRELFERDFVVVHSSGSTGAIGIFVYSRTDWNVMNGIMADRLPQPENFPAGRTRVGFFRVAHGHFAGVATAVHLPNAVYDTLIVSMLEPAERAIEELQRFQPHRMTGYSSSIETIAHWAIEGRLRIAPQRIFVSGDLLTPSILKTIRQAWRAPISNLYGASESLFIGLQDVDVPEMTLMDDLNVIEVVDEENREVAPGQEGRVVLTNLYNHTLPILRYDLGDYVVRGKTLASGFSSIEGIRPGKTGEALPIVLDDGTPEMLTERALTSFYAPGLERAQFIFQEPGRVQIDYVAGNTIDDEIRKEFGRILAMKGASQMPLGTRRVASIAPDPRTGKVRLVVRPDPMDPPKQTLRVAGVQAGTQANTVRSPPDCADPEIGRSIPKVFERQVEQYPDRLAVKSGRDSLTYAELNRAANGVAHALLVRSGAASEPIGMMLSPGIGPVVAILGILKAGKFYVPLDPGFPRQRLKAIVDNAACAIIVTDDANIALVSALAHRAQLINIDALSPVPEDNPGLAIRPGSNAYLLYTSGSSGRPKGVIQSHRNVMHQLTSYAKGLNIGPLDRLTLLHAYGFSAARLDIFGALLSGAGLFHFSVAEEGLGQLARWLQEEEITLLHWVPTAFRHWGDVLDASDQFPRLRLVVLGSEALSWRDIELHRRHFSPACVLVNRFGTTETGNICWSFIDTHTQLADGAVAVGCAIEDTEVLILDDAGIGVGPGQIGEIAVASEYLSPGYWGQPELSRSAFVADAAAPGRRIYRTGDFGYKLPDGSVVHAGRKDLQIKIRGHRVEVAEIETALLAHPAIKEAAVAMGDEQAGDQRLLAYVVARGEPRPANAAIRAYLEPRVPAHMMPSGFVWMDKLPLTPSGKLDRLALSGAAGAGAARSTEFVAPRTPTEQTLSGIWSEVLAVDGIGVDDDFFDLGGHSLHAGRILGSVWQRFGVEVQFRDLFDSPTIGGMAQIIDRERTGS